MDTSIRILIIGGVRQGKTTLFNLLTSENNPTNDDCFNPTPTIDVCSRKIQFGKYYQAIIYDTPAIPRHEFDEWLNQLVSHEDGDGNSIKFHNIIYCRRQALERIHEEEIAAIAKLMDHIDVDLATEAINFVFLQTKCYDCYDIGNRNFENDFKTLLEQLSPDTPRERLKFNITLNVKFNLATKRDYLVERIIEDLDYENRFKFKSSLNHDDGIITLKKPPPPKVSPRFNIKNLLQLHSSFSLFLNRKIAVALAAHALSIICILHSYTSSKWWQTLLDQVGIGQENVPPGFGHPQKPVPP